MNPRTSLTFILVFAVGLSPIRQQRVQIGPFSGAGSRQGVDFTGIRPQEPAESVVKTNDRYFAQAS